MFTTRNTISSIYLIIVLFVYWLVSQVQNEGLGGAGSSSPGTAVAVAVAGVAGCAAFAVLATVVVHHRRAKAASTPVDVPLV